MELRGTASHPSPTPISIGNFKVSEAPCQQSLQISLSKASKIHISVVEEETGDCGASRADERGDYYFVLANPNDSDDETKALLKEVLNLYVRELPAMNYAANTGKESTFLEKCLSNGKYCSLLLKSKKEQPGEVIGAITYQIIPADTQYAEIPLAAVSSMFQHKGIGRMMYLELRNRLQNVGLRNVFCWGDKESEGFWLKQGFTVIGKVDKRGKARRIPVKADIRRALCFPGDSTLMVSHLLKDSSPTSVALVAMPTKLPEMDLQNEEIRPIAVSHETPNKVILVGGKEYSGKSATDMLPLSGTQKRVWEASCTSLKSKKVKGTQSSHSQMGSQYPAWMSDGRILNSSDRNYLLTSGNDDFSNACLKNSASNIETNEGCIAVNTTDKDCGAVAISPASKCFRVMLMNIADDNKKSNLAKVIKDLGGVVTCDGSESTHVITGIARKTLNFCTALCSGSWIVSPGWLKESFKKGRFVDEMPFILDDEDYKTKFRTDLKFAILRAKANPNSFLKGLDIWLSAHVQPSPRTLSAIVKCAGGNVISDQSELSDTSKTIFIACDEDMEEARLAVKLGTWTYNVDWLMNCIMRQELDLDAPQFAESL